MKQSSVALLVVVSVVLCPASDALITGASTGWEGVNWLYESLLTLLYFLLVLMLYNFVSSNR